MLRVYSFDASAAEREPAVLRLVSDTVPAPRVLRAEPHADPPWTLMSFVDAERFDLYIQHASNEEVGAAAFSAGEALAAIHRFHFPKAGYFDADLNIIPPPWPDLSWSEMLEGWIRGGPGKHLGPDLARRLSDLIARNASRVDPLRSEAYLVHSDFKPWNMLARDRHVAAVLDWEGSFAGSRLFDVGIFLRYSASLPPSYLPAFLDGYRAAGGELPDDWYAVTRLTDLINLLYFLEDVRDVTIVRDVVPLIESTVTELGP